jgi:crotonobetainyl-CoA:carnitine CoA-transferase CaiB-like acyl-CoA transferase
VSAASRQPPAASVVPGPPLTGIHVTCIAIYVPALVAAQRLRALGATVTVVEPPAGDPMATMCRPWYDALHDGATTLTLDLKSAVGRGRLEDLLDRSDALVTALRPVALERLGLGWGEVRGRFPRLVHVAIVGYSAPANNEPGHDLTYQARAGLLQPPQVPRTLVADLAGAERAAQAVLALLLARERGQPAARVEVSLADAVDAFADPVRFGITAGEAVLGGGFAGYGIYRSRDGWVALAALEPHFWRGVLDALAIPEDRDTRAALTRAFASNTSEAWERWAQERDLPLTAIADHPQRQTGTAPVPR